MALIEPKTLIGRLTTSGRNALETAIGHAVTSRHYEVCVEHFLLALLGDAQSDMAFLTMNLGVNPSVLTSALQRDLETLRTGNDGKPRFDKRLFELFEHAFLVGSAEYGYAKLRTGVIFFRFFQDPTYYLAAGLNSRVPDVFEGLSADDLKGKLTKIIAGSKEEAESNLAASIAGAPGEAGKLPVGAASARADTALGKFCVDYTGRARAGQIDPIFGREREIRQMVDILARRRKNNPIIVGDAGVGKTALVEGLALMVIEDDRAAAAAKEKGEAYHHKMPSHLQGVEILGLDMGLLQAGAGVKGEFENRIKGVISEVKGSAKPIVLFIDEAHTMIGAGGSQGGGDAANLLKPALARGELRTIAATTWSEYKKYFEKDAALARRFQPVKVDEPSVEQAITMLRGLRPKFEESHGVVIRDEAVTAAVRLSARYITGRQLPDKAVDLLDTCAARVKVALEQEPAPVEDARVHIVDLETELAALAKDKDGGARVDAERIANLEAKLVKAKEALATVSAAYAVETDGTRAVVEARKKLTDAKGDAERDVARQGVMDAIDALEKSQGEVPLMRPDVDEAMVAMVVAAWTGIPVGKMVQDDVRTMIELEDRLRRRIKGQDPALATIAKELRAARAGLKPQSTPQGVFILVGPSGVGKTETALTIADLLYGGERMMVTINMSEFQEKHTVSRLIGSPPGYVGYGEGGMLTEAVRQKPYTVVLLDECEKADPDVLNLFYQVFDKGMLSDGEGRLVDFKNTVIILTSNLATDKITNMWLAAQEEGQEANVTEILEAIKPTLSAHFKPALLARMTMVPYLPISSSALGMITRLKLNGLVSRLHDNQHMEATYSDALVELIASRCTEVDTGARNIDHILRASLLPMLSSAILEKMTEGALPKKLHIDIDDTKQFVATFPE
jgi:type VI secretion system protein VasG